MTLNQAARIPQIVAYPGYDVHVCTWWQVHRDSVGALVQMREITVWEGRRVREFLRDTDAVALNDINRTCQSFEYRSIEFTVLPEQIHSCTPLSIL